MGNKIFQFIKVLIKPLRPSYDEASLFFMSVTCIILFATDSGLQHSIFKLFTTWDGGGSGLYALMWAIPIVLGLYLSLIHAFSSRKKSDGEKTLMAIFAMAINGLVGVQCGIEQMHGEKTWLIIFPIINIVSAIALIYQIGLVPEGNVQDEDVLLEDVILGSFILMVMLSYCSLYARFTWEYTYSICIAYTTNIDRAIRFVKKSLMGKPDTQPSISILPAERKHKKRRRS
jgi:hypothetical protein